MLILQKLASFGRFIRWFFVVLYCICEFKINTFALILLNRIKHLGGSGWFFTNHIVGYRICKNYSLRSWFNFVFLLLARYNTNKFVFYSCCERRFYFARYNLSKLSSTSLIVKIWWKSAFLGWKIWWEWKKDVTLFRLLQKR